MSGSRELVGRHLVADLDGIEAGALRDASLHRRVLRAALSETGHTVLEESCHEFAGGGFTLVFLLAESHLAVHTYPELGYLAFDLFSCGDHDPRAVLERLAAAVSAGDRRERLVLRTSRRRIGAPPAP